MSDSYIFPPKVREALKKVNNLTRKWAEEDWANEVSDQPTVMTYERAVELNRRSRELGEAIRELEEASRL
jgi:hypothetical protein